MISSPSQWQIDNASKFDRIIISKKPLFTKIMDFLSKYEPEYVIVKEKDSNGNLVEKIVDKRFVMIFTKEEINSKISQDIRYSKLNNDGSYFGNLKDGKIAVSINEMILFIENTAFSFPLSIIEECIEKTKRKFKLCTDSIDNSYLEYKHIKNINVYELEGEEYKYEFKNGFMLEFSLFKLNEDVPFDEKKDKFRIIEHMFKIVVSGNDSIELEKKINRLIIDKINILSAESNDKLYESTMLYKSYTEIIKECVEITKIKKEDESAS